MADSSDAQDAGRERGARADRSATGTPLWVKIFGVIAAIVVVLLIVLLLTGSHGPGRHTGMSTGAGMTMLAAATDPAPAGAALGSHTSLDQRLG
jgi:hypothetical protein